MVFVIEHSLVRLVHSFLDRLANELVGQILVRAVSIQHVMPVLLQVVASLVRLPLELAFGLELRIEVWLLLVDFLLLEIVLSHGEHVSILENGLLVILPSVGYPLRRG